MWLLILVKRKAKCAFLFLKTLFSTLVRNFLKNKILRYFNQTPSRTHHTESIKHVKIYITDHRLVTYHKHLTLIKVNVTGSLILKSPQARSDNNFWELRLPDCIFKISPSSQFFQTRKLLLTSKKMYSPQAAASPNPAMTTPVSSERRWVMDRGQEDDLLSDFKKLELKGALKPEPLLEVSLQYNHAANPIYSISSWPSLVERECWWGVRLSVSLLACLYWR